MKCLQQVVKFVRNSNEYPLKLFSSLIRVGGYLRQQTDFMVTEVNLNIMHCKIVSLGRNVSHKLF
jgi:hypothetical protein